MFLYYQLLRADCNAELISEYNTMEKIKQQCDECPDFIPTYDEYLRKDFSNYDSDFEYTMYIPNDEEVDALLPDGFITVIYEFVDGEEESYLVTKYRL